MTIHPPARLVGEPKETKKKARQKARKEERNTPETVANWLFAQTTHVVASNQTLHGGWRAVCSHVDHTRSAGRVSGQGGQNSARSAEKNFSFAHPGFQFAHPVIRNGCPPCPPYRGGFKGKGLVGQDPLPSSPLPSHPSDLALQLGL